SQITSAQYTLGAPGGATLTGSAVTVFAGDVFTTGDRSLAITGASMTVVAGDTFASPLAFVTGQELIVSAQEIGPRGVELTGLEVQMLQGDVSVPIPERRHAAATKERTGRKQYLYKGKRYLLTNEELLCLIKKDMIDISREDIKVTYKNQKPHPLSKQKFDELKAKADEEDIEAIIALL
ncbi:MAG: hypothetical protein ND866_04240, partial [Pyrinomonadaceae bacterium]|nr:hypothetical protein [Pyrinomonadaceae bacterium]